MKKKVLGTLLSVAMVASMLVGCGSGEAETAAPAATEGTPAADAEETPATDAPAADAEEAPAADAPAATGGKKVGVAMPTQSSERWIKDGDNMKEKLQTRRPSSSSWVPLMITTHICFTQV